MVDKPPMKSESKAKGVRVRASRKILRKFWGHVKLLGRQMIGVAEEQFLHKGKEGGVPRAREMQPPGNSVRSEQSI